MKTAFKIIIPAALIISVILLYSASSNNRNFETENKSFEQNKEIYEHLVSVILPIIEENDLTGGQFIRVAEEDGKHFLEFRDVLHNTKTRYETDKATFEKYTKLDEIYNSISNYSFIGLRYENNFLQFESENGEYFLIYTFDGVSPRKKNYKNYNNRPFEINHIEGNWYQMKQKHLFLA